MCHDDDDDDDDDDADDDGDDDNLDNDKQQADVDEELDSMLISMQSQLQSQSLHQLLLLLADNDQVTPSLLATRPIAIDLHLARISIHAVSFVQSPLLVHILSCRCLISLLPFLL